MTIQIGYAQATITPSTKKSVYLAGTVHNRLAVGVHDELYARALAIKQGEEQVILCALDLIGLGRVHYQEIEAMVNQRVKGAQVILACTHTHHGPDTVGAWGPDRTTSGVDPDYMAELKQKVSEVCVQALNTLVPAPGIKIASSKVTELMEESQAPDELDANLFCIQFWSATAPLVNLLIFPSRPEVVAPENQQITGDYPGYLREKVESETRSPAVFCMGALGELPPTTERTFEAADRIGRVIAEVALKALKDAQVVPFVNFIHRKNRFSIPLSNPLFLSALEIGLFSIPVNAAGEVETEANFLQFNQSALVGVPGELLPKLGVKIQVQLKEAGLTQANIIGLTNDEIGGIIPAEDFVFPEDPLEPGEHYMETISVGPEAGPRLVAAVRELLE